MCLARVLLLAALTASAASAAPIIDGDFADWNSVPETTDPNDASGPFDVLAVRAAGAGSRVAVYFEISGEVNLNSGSTSDGELSLLLGLPGGNTVRIDFRGRRATYNGSGIGWDDIGWSALPSFASTVYEASADLAGYGVGPGDTVTVQFAGRDSLAQPIQVVMGPADPGPTGSYARPAGADFRVASINTLQTGLFSGGQQTQLARLIDAVDADIYCFQEEYNSSATQIRNLLNSIDPLGDGAPWTVIKDSSDEVVATHLPLTNAGAENYGYVTGLVDLGSGRQIQVLSIHPKCCGYIGTSEDAQRIDQHQGMAVTIQNHPGTPAIVIGDWNLVGGREPLDILLDPSGPALTRLGFPHLNGPDGGGDEWTWRDLDGFGYPPGRLDLGVYDASGLTPLNAFTLDTGVLSPAQLAELGLQANDSRASDHLMLVADFRYGSGPVEPCGAADITTTNTNPGDPSFGTGDGQIDGADLSYFVENWLAQNTAVADVTTINTNPGDPGFGAPDGLVDGADLSYYVESWLAGCPG